MKHGEQNVPHGFEICMFLSLPILYAQINLTCDYGNKMLLNNVNDSRNLPKFRLNLSSQR